SMRRSTSRSPRGGTPAARRTPARARTAQRGKSRAGSRSRPPLTSRQTRELAGVLLFFGGLLAAVAEFSSGNLPLLQGIKAGLSTGLGSAWGVPVVAAVGVGAYLVYPRSPRIRFLDLVAGLVGLGGAIGLLGLVWGAGGGAGSAVAGAVAQVVGPVGAGITLTAML